MAFATGTSHLFSNESHFRSLLSLLPSAVYTCDATGAITYYNSKAAELWGREPVIGELDERFCGSLRLWRANGSLLPHAETPMAIALRSGLPARNQEVVIERPDGSRITVEVNIEPLRDEEGLVTGAVNVFQDISERKGAQAALVESEEDLRDFFENGAPAMNWLSADGTVLRANQSELQMLGYDEDEYVGHHIAEFHVSSEAIEDILARLRSGETVNDRPAELRCKDGSTRQVLVSASVLARDDEFIHARCFTRDVTEEVRANSLIRLYQEIFENSGDGIAIIDPSGQYVRENAAHTRLIGYTDEDLVGQTPAIHLGREQFARIAEELQKTGSFNGEVSSLTKDGRQLTLDLSSFAITDESGRLSHYVGMKRDVTERRKAEIASNRLAAIIHYSADAIVSKDLNGIIQTWNPGAERIFGYTAQEAIGRSIRMIIPEDRQSEEDEVLRRVRSGERLEHFETIRRRKDGSLVEISLTVSPIRDASGRIVGASKIARDISERRAAEEALKRSIAIKDQFLSLVSHELRTPISTILGNGMLLFKAAAKLSEDDRGQAYADIVSEAKRLQQDVENLLVLTRLDSGHLDWETLELPRILRRTIADFRERHPRREVDLNLNDNVPSAIGQEMLVTLVMQNLLTNADKYSDPDFPIEVSLDTNSDGYPEVRVLDQGIGMDENDLDSIFAPFYRSPSARGRSSGLGLGLAVCKRALESQGGAIGAQSKPGEGSCFFFSLQPAKTGIVK